MQEAKPGRIDVISDAVCPWCFIGKRQMERALALLAPEGLQFEVHWRPYQLTPDMPAGGLPRDEYRKLKFGSLERSRELDARVTAAAAGAALEFHLDRQKRTPNTLDAHRAIWLAERAGVQDAVVEALFRAYFIEGSDIGDYAVLADRAAAAGMNRDSVLAALARDDGREEVLTEDASARAAGLNGVPTFVMERHVLFSGAVPAETMAEAFRSAWKVLRSRAA
jgi:predicted DsbA family dithiol-disulfide isomerase